VIKRMFLEFGLRRNNIENLNKTLQELKRSRIIPVSDYDWAPGDVYAIDIIKKDETYKEKSIRTLVNVVDTSDPSNKDFYYAFILVLSSIVSGKADNWMNHLRKEYLTNPINYFNYFYRDCIPNEIRCDQIKLPGEGRYPIIIRPNSSSSAESIIFKYGLEDYIQIEDLEELTSTDDTSQQSL